jgi:hypothetical protein
MSFELWSEVHGQFKRYFLCANLNLFSLSLASSGILQVCILKNSGGYVVIGASVLCLFVTMFLHAGDNVKDTCARDQWIGRVLKYSTNR